MTRYKSDIKTISSSDEMVFDLLSDLTNLDRLSNHPDMLTKVKDLQFDADSCKFNVEGLGRIGFRISERTPNSLIELVSESSPIPIVGQMLLSKLSDHETGLQLVLDAEIPTMIKMMIDKKLKAGINTFAEALATALAQRVQ